MLKNHCRKNQGTRNSFFGRKLSTIPVLLTAISALLIAFTPGTAPCGEKLLISTIEYPPLFQKKATEGKGFGIARDITTEAFKAVGRDVEYRIIPMARCILMSKKFAANLGAINWYKNAGKLDQVVYENVTHSKFVLFYKKEKFPEGIGFNKIHDLMAYGKIGNVRGSSTTRIVNKASLPIDWSTDLGENFVKLKADRYDLAIAIELAGWAMLNQMNPDDVGKYDRNPTPLMEIPISLVVPKRNMKVYEDFKKGIKIIKENGVFHEIAERYYGKGKVPAEVLAILNG